MKARVKVSHAGPAVTTKTSMFLTNSQTVCLFCRTDSFGFDPQLDCPHTEDPHFSMSMIEELAHMSTFNWIYWMSTQQEIEEHFLVPFHNKNMIVTL